MIQKSDSLTIGYDYDLWYGYKKKVAISTDISVKVNSHILVCGMSGSGKSYCENILMAKIINTISDSECYFADYKQDDCFCFLRQCPRYYPYQKTLAALDIVYEKLHKRQSGEDKSRHAITLVWDEYVANILALQNEDKKKANMVMNKVSEILMLGRSLAIRMFVSCQRPDAAVFPSGSRLNYGIILILGAPVRSIYEMLIPSEYIDEIGERKFQIGEGVLLLQGSELHFIKVPTVSDYEKMQNICIQGLSLRN